MTREVALPPGEAWARLVDWGTHGDWIPMTRVQVATADPNAFTAWSGVGPLALEDQMRATDLSFDGTHGSCVVEKLGPVLTGAARFSVAPGSTPDRTEVTWEETVEVAHLPRFLASPAATLSRALFRWALGRVDRAPARGYGASA